MSRPRVRTADDAREVQLATFRHFADRDALIGVVLGPMLASVSTRRFMPIQEPIGVLGRALPQAERDLHPVSAYPAPLERASLGRSLHRSARAVDIRWLTLGLMLAVPSAPSPGSR